MQHLEVSDAVRHIYIYIYVIRRLKVKIVQQKTLTRDIYIYIYITLRDTASAIMNEWGDRTQNFKVLGLLQDC